MVEDPTVLPPIDVALVDEISDWTPQTAFRQTLSLHPDHIGILSGQPGQFYSVVGTLHSQICPTHCRAFSLVVSMAREIFLRSVGDDFNLKHHQVYCFEFMLQTYCRRVAHDYDLRCHFGAQITHLSHNDYASNGNEASNWEQRKSISHLFAKPRRLFIF